MSEWDDAFGLDPGAEAAVLMKRSALFGSGDDDEEDTGGAPLVIGPKTVEEDESGNVAKAFFIGGDEVPPSNADDPGDRHGADYIFRKSGSLAPPYNPHILVKLFEHSAALRPNIDAYCVNIDGFGHRFEPVIDLDKEESFEEVRTAMFFEALAEVDDGLEDGDPGSSVEVTDAEVTERIESLRHEMKLERATIEAFFKFATVEHSFIALRKRTRQDIEIQGNGYWEVLRNADDIPAQFNHVPAFTMRLVPADEIPTQVAIKVKRTAFTYDDLLVWRRFRRYVQIHEGRVVYFKEFGDRRIISSRTGKVFESVETMKGTEGEEDSRAATEIIHFSIPSSRSPYGIPRWVGTMISVIGSRQAEEINFLYFENKSVPPLAILVSGGRLAKDSVTKLQEFVENRIKGKRNFHKIMVIEAVPAGNAPALDHAASGRMTVEIKPLTDAQQKDSLFGNYDERNTDKIGMSFRLPRMLRGDIRDFNRSTAEAALAFAETQVFSPERNEFDWQINRRVFPEIGIRFWTFVSNGPKTRDPIDLAKIIVEMINASIFTPEEARELAAAVFNRDFAKLDELWTKIPPELLKKGILPDGEEEPEEEEEEEEDPEEEPEEGDKKRKLLDSTKPKKGRLSIGERKKTKRLRGIVKDLVSLRTELVAEEKKEAARAFEKAQHDAASTKPEVETIKIPEDEFRALFGNGDE